MGRTDMEEVAEINISDLVDWIFVILALLIEEYVN